MKAEPEDSPERSELKRHVLDDQQLEYAEKKSVEFRIRLGIHDRNSATVSLKVRGESEYRNIPYQLYTEDDFCELRARTSWNSTRVEVRHPYVWALAKHRAAEAILGVRNLHQAHTTKLRKAKATRKAQADT